MNKKQRLHLCDFDGTLARGDTFVHFFLFAFPLPRLALGSAIVVLRMLGLLFSGKWSNEAGKAAALSVFFKEKTEKEMRSLGEGFCQEKMPKMLRSELLASLRAAHRKGETVAIVSASPDVWLRPFCKAEGFDLLCTELEFEKVVAHMEAVPQFTGKFATPNCNGSEKARRIKAAYELSSFEKIIAYGNSNGDLAMFALADEVLKF